MPHSEWIAMLPWPNKIGKQPEKEVESRESHPSPTNGPCLATSIEER